MLGDILVRPKPKETSLRKRKAGINQKSVCLTDDDVFSGLKEEVQRKKNDKREKFELREEKKAEKERLKKEKR